MKGYNPFFDSEGTGRDSLSGPLAGGDNATGKHASKKNVRFTGLLKNNHLRVGTMSNMYTSNPEGAEEDENVQITLDIRGDSVALHSIQTSTGAELEEDDPELSVLANKMLGKGSSSSGSNIFRNTSNKFRQVSRELKRLASLSDKAVVPYQLDRTQSAVAQALVGFKFIATTKAGVLVDWNTVEAQFDELKLPTNGLLQSSMFGKCIGMIDESNEFAELLFTALARRFNITGNSINKEELYEFWMQLSDTNFNSRFQTFFDMYDMINKVDKDADGRINEADIAEIIRLSAFANKLSTIEKQAKEYAAMIMEELDPDNLGYIMMFSLEALLPKMKTRSSESRELSQNLSEQHESNRKTNPVRRWYRRIMFFVMDNWRRLWVMALWLVILSGLFIFKFVQYRNHPAYGVMGFCACTAKGAAETLKFNMALILLPVCRNTITWLRNKTKLGVAVPFDDNINFHEMIAMAISVGVVLHGGAHLTCDFPRLLHATKDKYEPLAKYFGEEQPDNYWWFVKGVEVVTGIVMVVLMAIAFTLAAPRLRNNKLKFPALLTKLKVPNLLPKLTGFNAFWYTHHLFVIVYTLLIVHGYYLYLTYIWYQKTTWMYLTVPMLLYAIERMIRAFRSIIEPVKILKASCYPGVLSLQMSKPHGFKYSSGSYMFIKCTDVSPFEWHPFSITSAPGDNYLSVHIRAIGDWTRQLRKIFNKPTGADFKQGETKYPRILIDGPYGAPAQEYKNYEVVILVGLGIGATPMISIVKDIINNQQNIKSDEEQGGQTPSCHSSPSPLLQPSSHKNENKNSFKTRRAYFYWVTREQDTFEWFRGIMNEVADMDKNEMIEFHNYCSSIHKEGDARSTLITMLQTLHHAKKGTDLIAGTSVKTYFDKPDWKQVFKSVAVHHPNTRVGVFYCGPSGPVKKLKKLALDFSHETSTKFEFHKENF